MAGSELDITDASLVERARRGDGTAFEALVRRHFRAAFAVALSVVGEVADAEDVCQDAFVKALERLDDCRDPQRFVAWLLRIVRNHALNFRDYRRVRAADPLEHVPGVFADSNPGRDAELGELREQLTKALSHLSETQRQVVLLHDLEGWKHREIAERLAISEGMSRHHLFAARRILRERLGSDVMEKQQHD